MEDLALDDGFEVADIVEGLPVRISGSHGLKVRIWEQRWPEPAEVPEADVEELEGICIAGPGDTGDCVVQTFEGLTAVLQQACLRPLEPLPPAAGGFDVAFVGGAGDADVGAQVAERLASRGYCVVQLPISRALCRDAAVRAEELGELPLLRRETELDYLGRDAVAGARACRPVGLEPRDALEVCDGYLSEVGSTICDPSFAGLLGAELVGRTAALARLGPAVDPDPFSPDEVEAGKVEEFIDFLKTRRVCMILMLESEGGHINLFPKPGCGEEVTLPVSRGKLLLFQHELMSYTYQPEGEHFALQAWLVTGHPALELDRVTADHKAYAELLGLSGPWEPEGDHFHVKSLMVRLPGRSWGSLCYWNMFCGGTDCVQEWEGIRWDKDAYYEPDRVTAMQKGLSYMRHGGFLDESEFNCFDNDFFGIPAEEARCMYPGQRIVLETGYEALLQAGFSKERCRGENIGVHLGDVGADWHSVRDDWPTHQCGGGDDESKRQGVSAAVTSTRLSYLLGLVGPINSLATACSSSLVALSMAHHIALNAREDETRKASGKELDEKHLIMGINTLMGPKAFMVQCFGGGTTYKGRCFSFDASADGYQRGEGCGAAFARLRAGEPPSVERLGTIIGSFVNQDGRSASLTAPNGPSQAALLRAAMRIAQMAPPDVTCCECHGTGTPLGDPIEIGALQGVLSKRGRPVLKTSAKSNLSHLEACAGMAGFAKCLMMVLASATPSNLHLGRMNPHVSLEGYPVYFTTEITPWAQNSGYCGVSSFGMGGTNARGEVLGRCRTGVEATPAGLSPAMADRAEFLCVPCPRCLGPMHWLDGAAVPKPAPDEQGPRYRASLIREELADYSLCSRCYAGSFRLGDEPRELGNPDYNVYIEGTWDAFQGMERMEECANGVYVAHAVLGETRCERFRICLERDSALAIYPARPDAGQHVRAQGPDADGAGRCWQIDGRDEEVPAGTVYRIAFEWRFAAKAVSWTTVAPGSPATGRVGGMGVRHRYAVAASWTSWAPQDMRPDEAAGQPFFECRFRIGRAGRESFHFVRDRDMAQVIYPARVSSTSSHAPTPPWAKVRGPDPHGQDQHWIVDGEEGEPVTLQLRVLDGHVTVTLLRRSGHLVRWESVEGWGRRTYSLVGPFNKWAPKHGMQQTDHLPGVFVERVQLEDECFEFQLMVDYDPAQLMYPQARRAGSGQGFLDQLTDCIPSGPEPAQGRLWCVQGEPGAMFDISLDMAELDRRKMVTWKQVGTLGLWP